MSSHQRACERAMRAVSGLLVGLAVAWCLAGPAVAAEFSPVGRHQAALGKGTGFGLESVNATGGYQTAVPLELPPPRGDLPLPVSVVYHGGSQVGEAGVGWSVPIYSVRTSASLSRRKPLYATGEPPLRVFLTMGGGPMLMHPTGEPQEYRPMVHESYLKLKGPSGEPGGPAGSSWALHDSSGRTYTFSAIPYVDAGGHIRAFGDGTLWLLTQITDATGQNRILFTYTVDIHTYCQGEAFSRLPDILLSEVAYAFRSGITTPKFRVRFNYTRWHGPHHETCTDAEDPEQKHSVLGRVIDDGFTRVRMQILDTIEVHAQPDESGAAPAERLRSYAFTYQFEAVDTRLPQLQAVRLFGKGQLPWGGAPGVPVAEYGHGTALVDGGLHYGAVSTLSLPTDYAHVPYAFSSTRTGDTTISWDPFTVVSWLRTKHLLRDFTGDGLPDYLQPFGEKGHTLQVSVPHKHGIQLDDSSVWSGGFPVTDAFVKQKRVEIPGFKKSYLETVREVLDWNGDGRLDILAMDEDSPRWHLYLNAPGASGSGEIDWKPYEINVAHLRDQLIALGHPDIAGSLPLARSRSHQGKDYEDLWNYWHTGGAFPEHKRTRPPEYPKANPDDGKTVTEWKLVDVNGDGYVDFVFNGVPLAIEERHTKCCQFPSGEELCGYPSFPDVPEHPWPPPEGAVPEATCHQTDAEHLEFASPNTVLVFYNASVGPLPYFHSASQDLLRFVDPTSKGCAVEVWRQGVDKFFEDPFGPFEPPAEQKDKGFSWMECGFVEVNGDGLVDYVAGRSGPFGGPASSSSVRLNNGRPLDAGGGLGVPGPVHLTYSERQAGRCEGAADWRLVETRQRAGLVDLTGDGIPDYVQVEVPAGGPPRGWVHVGTGVGFLPRALIHSPLGFEISFGHERCDGTLASTQAGLVDLHGDGRPLMVRADHAEGKLVVATVMGASGLPGAHDAGRLQRVENGYGATLQITYGNAKFDEQTRHRLPFSEVVVTETALAGKGPDSKLEPTRYAYGDAQMYYHPLLARWLFGGYGRRVELRGRQTTPTQLQGAMVIYDAVTPDEVDPGYDRYALSGRLHDTYFLTANDADFLGNQAGIFSIDPRDYLGVNVTKDGRLRGGVHMEYQTALVFPANDPTPPPPSQECYELLDPYAPGAFTTSPDRHLCRRVGYVYPKTQTAWSGMLPSEIAPHKNYVETQSDILAIDAFGQPTRVHFHNDTAEFEDDVCLETTYAQSTTDPGVFNAPYIQRLTNCYLEGNTAVIAGVRYLYDHLPEPEEEEEVAKVAQGLMTERIVERYDPQAAVKLEEYLGQARQHDAFGNVTHIITTPADGVSRTTTFIYDPFGLVPEQIIAKASDVAFVQAVDMTYDRILMLPDTVTDSNGVTQETMYDHLGRPERTSIATSPEGKEYLLTESVYVDNPADPHGRRVRQRAFHTWADAAAPAPAGPPAVTESTVFFDEFGRLARTERPLGPDYTYTVLVSDVVLYDSLGRPQFRPLPFRRGESPLAQYGTTYHYHDNGLLECAIQGVGLQPLDNNYWTDDAQDRYPTCFTYSFRDRQSVTQMRGPNELLPDSPELGAFDATYTSAIGRVLRRARVGGGRTLELAEARYDRLGSLIGMSRATDPAAPGAPVVTWTYLYDSLGQLLSLQEPGLSEQRRHYNRWGQSTRTTWLDSSESPPVERGSRRNYDGFGRLVTAEQLKGGGADPASPRITYAYDVAADDPNHLSPDYLRGRLAYAKLTYAEDESMTTFFGYDVLGRTVSTSRVLDGRRFADQVTLTPGGQPTELRFLLPDGSIERVDYAYDSARGLRTARWQGTEPLFQADDIDTFGRYRVIRLGNGVVESYAYRPDRRRELLEQRIAVPGYTIRTSYGAYDGEARLRGRTVEVLSDHPWSRATSYTYNVREQLERALSITTAEGSSWTSADERFSYDALGNLRQIDALGVPSVSFVPSPTDPDRICRRSGDPVPPICTYAYDAFGNVATIHDPDGPPRVFEYDTESHLVKMRKGPLSIGFRYGAFGELIQVDVSDEATPISQQARHFGPLLEESIGPGGSFIERRIPGPTGMFAVRRKQTDGSDVLVFRHGDSTANRMFTDAAGKVIQRVEYRPYGEITEDTGVEGSVLYSNYLWNGGETFKTFGLTRLGARAYDPTSGRFLQRDPLMVLATASNTNPYSFALNDPVNFADPTGLQADCIGLECHTGDPIGLGGLLSLPRLLWRGGGTPPRREGPERPRLDLKLPAPEIPGVANSVAMHETFAAQRAEEIPEEEILAAQMAEEIHGENVANPCILSCEGRQFRQLEVEEAGVGAGAVRLAAIAVAAARAWQARAILSGQTLIAVNRIWGTAAELRLARILGPGGIYHMGRYTPYGQRIFDWIYPMGRRGDLAIEVKTGFVLLTTGRGSTYLQVLRDKWLLANNIVKHVQWHFMAGPTGKGPAPELRELLQSSGIQIVEHPF
jgi:RHS repeat-associated protein